MMIIKREKKICTNAKICIKINEIDESLVLAAKMESKIADENRNEVRKKKNKKKGSGRERESEKCFFLNSFMW